MKRFEIVPTLIDNTTGFKFAKGDEIHIMYDIITMKEPNLKPNYFLPDEYVNVVTDFKTIEGEVHYLNNTFVTIRDNDNVLYDIRYDTISLIEPLL